MHRQNGEASVDLVRARHLRTMVGEDKKLISKSKVEPPSSLPLCIEGACLANEPPHRLGQAS